MGARSGGGASGGMGRGAAGFKEGVTKVNGYEISVSNTYSKSYGNQVGLNIAKETTTIIKKDGKVVAWNVTQPGGEKQYNDWVKEQKKKFKI